MRKPNFITFTGADDQTDVADLLALARDYEVEFGILCSSSRMGTPRYPSLVWVQRFQEAAAENIDMRAAAHMCGNTAKAALAGGTFRLHGFRRVQINTTDKPNTEMVRQWGLRHGVQPILQCRGPFPFDINVSWLFDPSGGRGERAPGWPVPYAGSPMVGYAGGIGPDTIADDLSAFPYEAAYWIDMESSLRDEADRFSIEKCRAVCEAVYGSPGLPS